MNLTYRLASSSMTGNELLSTGSNAQCVLAGKFQALRNPLRQVVHNDSMCSNIKKGNSMHVYFTGIMHTRYLYLYLSIDDHVPQAIHKISNSCCCFCYTVGRILNLNICETDFYRFNLHNVNNYHLTNGYA